MAGGQIDAERLAQVYGRICGVLDEMCLRDDLTATPVLLAVLALWHVTDLRHTILENALVGRNSARGLYFKPAPFEVYWDEEMRMRGTPIAPGPDVCDSLVVTSAEPGGSERVEIVPCPVLRAIIGRLGPAAQAGRDLTDKLFGFMPRYSVADIGTDALEALKVELAALFQIVTWDGPPEAARQFICHVSHHMWTVERVCEMAMQGNFAYYSELGYLGCDRSSHPAV
jgi:hypothetical protein